MLDGQGFVLLDEEQVVLDGLEGGERAALEERVELLEVGEEILAVVVVVVFWAAAEVEDADGACGGERLEGTRHLAPRERIEGGVQAEESDVLPARKDLREACELRIGFSVWVMSMTGHSEKAASGERSLLTEHTTGIGDLHTLDGQRPQGACSHTKTRHDVAEVDAQFSEHRRSGCI